MVAGSYPPIPVPAAEATVDAVRRALSEGHEVKVVSPRPSAAHYAGALVGFIAGRRLNGLRRVTRCDRLVFCLEPEVPFDPPGKTTVGSTRRAMITARLLARSFRRFDHTTLIIAGDSGAPAEAVRVLEEAADEVVEDRRTGTPPPGVTTRGPVEMRPRDLVRRFAGGAVRKVLRKVRR